jgi:hypothetical protein
MQLRFPSFIGCVSANSERHHVLDDLLMMPEFTLWSCSSPFFSLAGPLLFYACVIVHIKTFSAPPMRFADAHYFFTEVVNAKFFSFHRCSPNQPSFSMQTNSNKNGLGVGQAIKIGQRKTIKTKGRAKRLYLLRLWEDSELTRN